MRPKRLEVEGFASFRERAEISFDGARLFVLTGPTGAGKSSVVDALTFALYGSVPRYEDRRLVAPVITQGQQEARVRLDFSIGSEDFTAVRVVRRTGNRGAGTREARLERGEEVLAGNESELSQQVERLIGLSFEHFTKCVVLPQGEFAQFLRDKPKDRQALLVKLLDIGIYGRMAHLARGRHRQALEEISLNQKRLDQDLSHATAAKRKTVRRRVKELEQLQAQVEAAQPDLDRLAAELKEAHDAAVRIKENLKRLKGLQVPKEIGRLDAERSGLRAAEEACRQELEECLRKLEQLDLQAERLPDKVEIVKLQALRAELEEVASRAEREIRSSRRIEETLKRREQELEASRRRCEEARRLAREARDAHAAAHLAGGLKTGEPCPVCSQPVKTRPQISPPADLEAAESKAVKAAGALEKAERSFNQAREEQRVQQSQLERTRQRQQELERRLQGKPSPRELADLLQRWEQHEAAVREVRGREKQVRERESGLRRRRRELDLALSRAGEAFHSARDGLMGLEPPPAAADLAQAWAELDEWGRAQLPRQQKALEQLLRRVDELKLEESSRREALAEACRVAGLDLEGRTVSTLVTEALLDARGEQRRIEADLEKAKELRARVKRLRQAAQLAKEMSSLLGSRGFERWHLNRAMRQLVAGASQVLRELSTAQYSLTLDDQGKDFLVVDHNSADERRLARTLSGGETFLASLALALALSEHVAGLSARGAARLEAIFLDEGFGTLDPDTLEIVASAMDELGQKGRMVGLITHVRELAGRIPVRFEVTKDAHTSRIERIIQ